MINIYKKYREMKRKEDEKDEMNEFRLAFIWGLLWGLGFLVSVTIFIEFF